MELHNHSHWGGVARESEGTSRKDADDAVFLPTDTSDSFKGTSGPFFWPGDLYDHCGPLRSSQSIPHHRYGSHVTAAANNSQVPHLGFRVPVSVDTPSQSTTGDSMTNCDATMCHGSLVSHFPLAGC